MTDAEYAKTKRRIQRLADKWIGMAGLATWDVDLVYERAGLEGEKKSDGRRAVISTTSRWEYQQASVSFDMIECFDLEDENLEECFVHELAHVLVNEMREGARTDESVEPLGCTVHEERVATMVANALIWTDRHMTVPVVALARRRSLDASKGKLVETKKPSRKARKV